MAGALGDTIRGTVASFDFPVDLRIYEKDRATAPFFRYRGFTPFVNALLTQKAGKKGVTDIKFTHYEQAEEPVKMTLVSDGNVFSKVIDTTGYALVDIGVSDAHAAFLQAGAILTHENGNVAISSGTWTYSRPSVITSVNRPINMEVVAVDTAGSWASGATRVRVLMPHADAKGTAAGLSAGATYGEVEVPTTTDLFQSGDSVIRGAKTNYDSGSPGYSITLSPVGVDCFTQLFEKPFAATEFQRNIRTFSIKDKMQYLLKVASWSFVREVERAFLYQGEGYVSDRGGKELGKTLSLNGITPTDTDHRRTIQEETPYGVDEALRPFSEYGKSFDNRWLFCSPYFITKFGGLFHPYMTESPLSGAKGLGYQVYTYQDKLNVPYKLVYCRELGVSSRFAKSAFVVDMDSLQYAYLNGEERSFDVYVDDGDGEGLQPRGSKDLKYQLRANIGLAARDWDRFGEIIMP